MRFKHEGSFYSASGLAQVLGIDSHAVTRWIKSGHLKPKLRGTARGPQQNGDSYLIQDKDVRRFILEHPPKLTCAKWTRSGSWIMWNTNRMQLFLFETSLLAERQRAGETVGA